MAITKGKKIVGEGITSKIDPSTDGEIKYDEEGRFYTISQKLADLIISQTHEKIPLCLSHKNKYTIGTVTGFSKKEINEKDVLVAHFEITSQPFLNALIEQASMRYNFINPTFFTSPDNFIPRKSSTSCDTNEKEPVIVNARHVLTQKFPGLSLGHNPEDKSVRELSICLAGARDLSVITDALYVDNSDINDQDTNSEQEYMTVFSANLAHSNFVATQKVAKDFNEIGGDPTRADCLAYMHKAPQIKNKDTQNRMESDRGQSDMDRLLKEIMEVKKVVNNNNLALPEYSFHKNQQPKRISQKRHRREYVSTDDGDDDDVDEDTYGMEWDTGVQMYTRAPHYKTYPPPNIPKRFKRNPNYHLDPPYHTQPFYYGYTKPYPYHVPEDTIQNHVPFYGAQQQQQQHQIPPLYQQQQHQQYNHLYPHSPYYANNNVNNNDHQYMKPNHNHKEQCKEETDKTPQQKNKPNETHTPSPSPKTPAQIVINCYSNGHHQQTQQKQQPQSTTSPKQKVEQNYANEKTNTVVSNETGMETENSEPDSNIKFEHNYDLRSKKTPIDANEVMINYVKEMDNSLQLE